MKNQLTRTFLADAIEEALYRQTNAFECLEQERIKLSENVRENESKTSSSKHSLEQHQSMESDGSKSKKDPRVALERVNARRDQLNTKITKLEELRKDLFGANNNDNNATNSLTTLEFRFRSILGSIDQPCPILDRPQDTWKITQRKNSSSSRDFGRPRGFEGPLFYSPLGVPILIGKPKSESDAVLRRAAQGSDLWFQVEDYEGSRVLLRSSLVRGTKDSKECVQMAADLAAYYSVWGGGTNTKTSQFRLETVPVMYTDSKHVAKRGPRAGRMRKRKSLGRVMGRPSSVTDIACGSQA